MRHAKFMLLNIIHVVVTIIASAMLSGVFRIEADQPDEHFKNFDGVEEQRDANGGLIRKFRWSSQDGVLYFVRQPNDNGLHVMSLTATTISNNQSLAVEIDQQQVTQFEVQPQLFRTYHVLVNLQWPFFDVLSAVSLKNSATEVVTVAEGQRYVGLAMSDVVFTPLTGTKYPNGMVIVYVLLVIVIGIWSYFRFSPKVVIAIYGVFVLAFLCIGWLGFQSVVSFILRNIPFVVMLCGFIGNLLLLYYLYRYFVNIQAFALYCVRNIEQRLLMTQRYIAPIYGLAYWLWRRPILLYSLTIMLYFGGWLWGTQVLSPIDTKLALNMPFTLEHGYFSDYVLAYVPERYLIVNEPRSTWISTWSNQIELGREIRHGTTTQSYVLNWLMEFLFADPHVFFTVAFVFYVYLTGLFALLYVRRQLQDTGLALLAAYLITCSPFTFFWNTYMTFWATTCWGVAILYGLRWMQDTPNWKSLLFLMFAVYSLFSVGHQQIIIHFAYMMLAYYVYVFWQLRVDNHKQWQFVKYSIIAVVIGVIMTIPQYLDIFQTSSLTDLNRRDKFYFLKAMPYLNTVLKTLKVFSAYVLKDIFETTLDSNSSTYPYRGGYTTLFVFLFMLIGMIWRWRETWGWSLWVIIAVGLSFSRTVFTFGYEQLHLPQFSRVAVFFGTTQQIPEMMLALYGVQVIIREPVVKSLKILLGMFVVGLQLIVVASAVNLYNNNFSWGFAGMQSHIVFEIFIAACILVMALLPFRRVRWAIIFGVLFLQTAVLFQPMLLTRPLHTVETKSSTTEMIRQTLGPNERMAMVDNLVREIPNAQIPRDMVTPFGGNYHVVSEIANIGTYNPLQSKYYARLMTRFGVPAYSDNYVRAIELPMPENDQWMANIRTIVSRKRLDDNNLMLKFRTEGFFPFYVYTTASTMGCCLQVPMKDVRMVTSGQQVDYWVDSPKSPTNRQLEHREYQGDRFVVPVTESNSESIIVFSQIFHPQWYARVRTAAGWQDATTLVVNEAYQGVKVPIGTQEVVMEFRPWIFWGIIPNMFWLGCGLFITVWWLWTYKPLRSWYQYTRERLQPN